MQTNNLAFVLAEARQKGRKDPFGLAVRASIEVGVVVPSILRGNLTAAGFVLKGDEAAVSDYGFASSKVLKRTLITDKHGELVAMGAAGDHDEALLHAALGYFREHSLTADVPEGIATAPQTPAAT